MGSSIFLLAAMKLFSRKSLWENSESEWLEWDLLVQALLLRDRHYMVHRWIQGHMWTSLNKRAQTGKSHNHSFSHFRSFFSVLRLTLWIPTTLTLWITTTPTPTSTLVHLVQTRDSASIQLCLTSTSRFLYLFSLSLSLSLSQNHFFYHSLVFFWWTRHTHVW